MSKVCNMCKECLPLDDFYIQRSSKDGHCYRCKVCQAEYQRSRPEQRAETNKRWYEKHGVAYLERKRAETKEKRLERYKEIITIDLDRWRKNRSLRSVAKLKATPIWADAEHRARITEIYAIAQQLQEITGAVYHVDHIVPLRGKTVCGLHVWWNLQPLLEKSNIVKGDVFDATIFPEQGEVAFPSGDGRHRALRTLSLEM